jgi:hypothetical protein
MDKCISPWEGWYTRGQAVFHAQKWPEIPGYGLEMTNCLGWYGEYTFHQLIWKYSPENLILTKKSVGGIKKKILLLKCPF